MLDFPYTVDGEGPLIVFSYRLGKIAWGSLDEIKQTHTVVVIDWPKAQVDPALQISHGWFGPLVKKLGHERSALCTWSMGAPAAIRFAAKNPRELSQLILVDPAGLGSVPPRARAKYMPHAVITRLRGKPTRGYVRMLWRNWIHNRAVDSRSLEDAMWEFWSTPGAFTRNQQNIAQVVKTPLTDSLTNIQAPTLILTGRHSTVLGPALAESAAAALPIGDLKVFENSAHTLQLEEPEMFSTCVLEFLHQTTAREGF